MASEDEIALRDITTTTSTGFERQSNHSVNGRYPQHEGEQEQLVLPKADGGRQAWLVLTACFFIEALIWGKSIAFLRDSFNCSWSCPRFSLLVWYLPRVLRDSSAILRTSGGYYYCWYISNGMLESFPQSSFMPKKPNVFTSRESCTSQLPSMLSSCRPIHIIDATSPSSVL